MRPSSHTGYISTYVCVIMRVSNVIPHPIPRLNGALAPDASGVFERLPQLLHNAIVMIGRQDVSGRNDKGHRPIDDPKCRECRQTPVERQLVWPWDVDAPGDRQVHGEGLCLTHTSHRLHVG
jgi:hypothetical protein